MIVEWSDPGGADGQARPIAPPHVHHADDEAWYVLEGKLGFRLGEDEIEAPAGSAVLAERGTPHSYWNPGPGPARYLLVMTPRIHRLIDELHAPESHGADFRAIFRKYDSELLG